MGYGTSERQHRGNECCSCERGNLLAFVIVANAGYVPSAIKWGQTTIKRLAAIHRVSCAMAVNRGLSPNKDPRGDGTASGPKFGLGIVSYDQIEGYRKIRLVRFLL